MWKEVLAAAAACLAGTLVYLVNGLIYKRKQLADLPQPPMQYLFLGHLYIADECTRLFPKDIHSHVYPGYIKDKWNMPDIFYVDWRPFGPLWCFISDPEIASEYVIAKQSLPKSYLECNYLQRFLGKHNMVCLEGQEWKRLRSMFNPGFSASNIMTYTDAIVTASLRFVEVLREKARTNESFELEDYATRLTIDIIGIAVFDVDMDAQRKLHPIVHYFRERVLLMPGASDFFPWQGVKLSRPFRLWWNGRKLDQAINNELEQKVLRRAKDLSDEASGKKVAPKKRSIIDLALNTYEKEMAMGQNLTAEKVKHITDPKEIPTSLRMDLVDSIKTFFFAGHDTTSSTISWTYYLLHRNPGAQKQLEAELNHFFPRGTSAADTIRQDPYIINKLEYTTAVIKETMRIFPPASTLRRIDPKQPVSQSMITDPTTGHQFPLKDTHIWAPPHMFGRNKRFFPQPLQFIPERFIPSQTPFPEAELFRPSGKNAYQPFSIGPRNCIGQELAMIEAKIILALTAREIDFVLEYPGEEADPQPSIPESNAAELDESTEYGKAVRNGSRKPDTVEGHRVWQALAGSAKPNGHCPGRVYLRQS